jgi:Tfp pilus assembly protein PilX
MLKNNKNVKQPEQGFITMIVMMVLILGAVIYLAYTRVVG